MRKLLWIIPAILGIGLAIYFMYSEDSEAATDKPVLTTAVSGPFSVSVQATGELRAKNSVKIRGPLRMREAGIWQTTISKILPEGTKVKKGDWVASLDKSGITTKFDETQNEIEKIKTQLEQARIDTTIELSNMRDQLVDLKFDVKEKELLVEQSQFEAQMIIQQAKLSLQRIKRDYSQLKKNYGLKQKQSRARIAEINTSWRQARNKMKIYQEISDEFEVKAPEDGMLIYISRWGGDKLAVGGQVSAWDSKVGELPDLSHMISVTYVNEVDISKVKMGQQVEMGVDAFPDKKFDGTVTKVANVGQQLRNQDAKVFEVIVELNGSDSTLRPSMTTSNNVIVRRFEDVVFIPLEALSQDSIPYVIKKTKSKSVKQEVLLGPANENHVVVELGLNTGDEVYLYYTGDKTDLNLILLDDEEKQNVLQSVKTRNTKYDKEVNEKAKLTSRYEGQTEESNSSFIIIE